MDNLDFLDQAGTSDSTATLMVLLPDSTVTQIHKVSPFIILDKCPLLYHAFEFGAHSVRQASIEATSRTAIVVLLRFLYTGSYILEDEQCSLLTHAEAFKIGEDYDVPELQVSAYVNFTRETEFSCCMPTPPPVLCETIQFLYKHFASQQARQQQSLLDTLLHYCLGTFKYHGLGEREDFRDIVFNTPAFHRDLCRTSMDRNFEDEGAAALLCLPVSSPTPYSRDNLNKRALGDFQFELWQDSEEFIPSPDSDVEKSPAKRRRSDIDGLFTVVHRPKNPKDKDIPTFSESESDSEPSSDEHGFMPVHRPKPELDATIKVESPTSTPSSPEFVPVTPANIKSEPKSETAADLLVDEEDWDLV